ncbi:MAG: hypothetical protein ABIS29_12090 [Vicinamibacterales bacterium]
MVLPGGDTVGLMLTLALILVALWVLGSVSSVTMGGGLHIFLLAGVGIMLPRIIWGRKSR